MPCRKVSEYSSDPTPTAYSSGCSCGERGFLWIYSGRGFCDCAPWMCIFPLIIGFTDICRFFPDGFKTIDRVCASTVFPDCTLSHCLSFYASIFTTELMSIFVVNCLLEIIPQYLRTIISDSKLHFSHFR